MYDCIPQKSCQTVVCGLELFNRQAAETFDIANFRWNRLFVRKLIKKVKSDFQEAKFSWIYVNLHIYELTEYDQILAISTYAFAKRICKMELLLRVNQTKAILFLKSISERVGSDIKRLWNLMTLTSIDFESI